MKETRWKLQRHSRASDKDKIQIKNWKFRAESEYVKFESLLQLGAKILKETRLEPQRRSRASDKDEIQPKNWKFCTESEYVQFQS